MPKQSFQNIQAIVPEALIEAEPFLSALERPWLEMAEVNAAAHFTPNEPRRLQGSDVFRRSRERHVEGGGELTDCSTLSGQFPKHLASGLIA